MLFLLSYLILPTLLLNSRTATTIIMIAMAAIIPTSISRDNPANSIPGLVVSVFVGVIGGVDIDVVVTVVGVV